MIDKNKKFNINRLLIVSLILIIIIGTIMGLYWGLGINKKLNDEEGIKKILLQYGSFSRTIYILLHFLQSTLLPISNFPTIVAGGYIFNPWENSLLTSIGVILGSYAGFGIGKVFGRKAVDWVVGEESTTRILKTFEGKEKLVLILILILPFFPDDIICFIAGITLISWPFFMISVLLIRPIPVILMCFFGSGEIIPFRGYGLIIWGAIILSFIIIGHLVWKHWTKINAFLEKINNSFFHKEKEETINK